jgi:hypothetical protein
MSNMAKALERSELKIADEIHVNLMLDYPSEVSLWMVGIKKLIHELINLNQTKADQATINDDIKTESLVDLTANPGLTNDNLS